MDKMDWKTTPPPPAARQTQRRARLEHLRGSGQADVTWTSFEAPGVRPAREQVWLSAFAHFDDPAEAERCAEAVAAEWPHFVAAVQARMADATNLPANARVVEDR